MKNVPTMSDTDQLLGCTWPYGREVEREETDESRFGTKSHACFADRIRLAAIFPLKNFKGGAMMQRERLACPEDDRALAGIQALNEWLVPRLKEWGPPVEVEVESPYAVNIKPIARLRRVAGAGCVRKIKPPDEKTHEYAGVQRWEIPGVLDLMMLFDTIRGLRGCRRVAVIDFKTGQEVDTPLRSGQLCMQALAACLYHNATVATIGHVHAPEAGVAAVITDEVTCDDLVSKFAPLVYKQMKRIGDGTMRPWTPELGRKLEAKNWCTYCRVRDDCPVSSRDLVVDAADALGHSIVRKAGVLVNGGAAGKIISRERLGQIIRQRSAIEGLNRQLGPMIQADILENGPAHYGGKVYTVETTAEWDHVSVGTITRALGKVAAAREIERLRKRGCVEKRSQTKIQGRNE